MKTQFIPFARMTRKQQREHLAYAHGIIVSSDQDLVKIHITDHRVYDGTVGMSVQHEHTKVTNH